MLVAAVHTAFGLVVFQADLLAVLLMPASASGWWAQPCGHCCANPRFEPRDPGLLAQLKSGKAGLSQTGNLWNGIKGVHLSHSLGLVLFGAFYTTLALIARAISEENQKTHSIPPPR